MHNNQYQPLPQEVKMHRPGNPLPSLLSAIVLASAFGVPLHAQQQAAGASTLRADEASAPRIVWTPESRASAIPMPLGEATGFPGRSDATTPAGPAGSERGMLPGQTDGPPVRTEGPAPVGPEINGGVEWYSYPPPFTRWLPRYGYSRYPHSTMGKLFFSDGFGNYVCSGAAVVCAGELDLVMTAGHCCSDGAGSFYTGWQFVPACQGPGCSLQAPYGFWDWESVTVFNAWHLSGDWARDECFLKVAPNGPELHTVTGSLGFSWNQTQPVHYVASGWPQDPPFNGNLHWLVGASAAERDGSLSPETIGIGNDMTKGSSGGAWVQSYKQGATATSQFWNGLNSYKYTTPSRPQEMFGPYVDTTVNDLRTGSIGCN
jgi:hypothetical protein